MEFLYWQNSVPFIINEGTTGIVCAIYTYHIRPEFNSRAITPFLKIDMFQMFMKSQFELQFGSYLDQLHCIRALRRGSIFTVGCLFLSGCSIGILAQRISLYSIRFPHSPIYLFTVLKYQIIFYPESYLPGPGVSLTFQWESVKRASWSNNREPLLVKLEITQPFDILFVSSKKYSPGPGDSFISGKRLALESIVPYLVLLYLLEKQLPGEQGQHASIVFNSYLKAPLGFNPSSYQIGFRVTSPGPGLALSCRGIYDRLGDQSLEQAKLFPLPFPIAEEQLYLVEPGLSTLF